MAVPLRLIATTKFHKDTERMKRRGKDMAKITVVLDMLVEQKLLPAKYSDHNITRAAYSTS